MNLAAMPPNGVAVIVHNRQLTLPSADAAGCDAAWEFLQQVKHAVRPCILHYAALRQAV
jgi:hypothetical protein